MIDFNEFKFIKVIGEDAELKRVNLVLQREASNDLAIVLLERLGFEEGSVSNVELEGELVERNDIYYRYVDREKGLKYQVIFPSNKGHLAKYSGEERGFVLESVKTYKTIVKPYFEGLNNTRWIDNIIEKREEVEGILYEDADVVVVRDSKWIDQKNLSELYYLVLFKRGREWVTVRDLQGKDLEMLIRAREGLRNEMKDRIGIEYEDLKAYFHYPPTFGHLHLHVIWGKRGGGGSGVGGAILFEDVIMELKRGKERAEQQENGPGDNVSFGDLRGDMYIQYKKSHELYKKINEMKHESEGI